MARAFIGAGKTRHTRVLLAAVFGALLSLMRVSRGTWGSSLGEIGEAPEGASYIAGELPIVYETDVPSAAAEEVPEASGGEVEEEIPEIDAQLIEFPGVKDEPTERRRERLLNHPSCPLLKQTISSQSEGRTTFLGSGGRIGRYHNHHLLPL